MMTAEECRAHANMLIRYADECPDIHLVVELETTAAEWRRLAAFADAQDALWAALAATRDGPLPVTPGAKGCVGSAAGRAELDEHSAPVGGPNS